MCKEIEVKDEIDCGKCSKQSDCCRMGAWIDLEEAKRILESGIKGDFFHLEIDKEFPSGYKVGTSYEDEQCVFLDTDGLCRIHKVDYALKPVTCKEFPYEGGKISPIADVLCLEHKARIARAKSGEKK
ncbi:MAG: YkgJ family cysteine cluster protein [Candidatus Omnitrophica bacterium]|jgi:Fe-S-cluster containining protein|nr:YkgJ family cysteine cluster protein [Candidatus Omnitrophota bacterium]MDD3275241.1 YkgJ family cysteine cluster protein [Candidatus Omnitrophota bacterium]MDD5077854.1 YkgJ family cysteine cluster protein [Candidatus Omnitrophota bacterium]MDD5725651.1 YkgJ family cysteine cluster protein [Candidatus Omnitrophota bacterium]